MDVRNLNLVNRDTRVIPNYSVSKKEASIRLYFNREGKVLIIGRIDNNYIHWASFTNTDDKELNAAIFKYIADESIGFEMVSSERAILEFIKVPYDALDIWYRTELYRKREEGAGWETPFGHNYGKNAIELTASSFAYDVSKHLDVLLRRCRFREANGLYESVLDYCLCELSKDGGNVFYYECVVDLISMLQQEQYLILSDQEQIREKYFRFRKEVSRLYNQCQAASR
ncbi:hypothetical protein [Anaerocolumna xylanovorans]|uniref:Uncharacterized protein n=1 Tax=Anaerocolumna xylanovorans DSM 12503 TaxID=1121345 RepID=A0A1M7YI96_9FIRM|nr:hypothetical protein [Anaerocolumna xylanovorans]SHO52352.1 hypothetical protein SAMN02745217_03604 [Anaerocolumna xylanovorans DSM 12503]